MRPGVRRQPTRRVVLAFLLILCVPHPSLAQSTRAVGREAALGLRFEELSFHPPMAQKKSMASGVTVFVLEDHTLPLATLYARFRGGYALLPRSQYAAASALPSLLRNGGTSTLSPDSVESLLDFYALQTGFGGGGENAFSSMNTLSRHLEPAIALWADMLRNPGFDPREVEVWRERQMESTRRRGDDPRLLAVSEFNRIMFGDHPVGWELGEEDLSMERFNQDALFEAHSRILCRGNLILGVVGDVRWTEIEPLLESMVSEWPPCEEPLPEPLTPHLRRGRTVFLIPKELTQSTVVMAAPGGISQGPDPDYFSSRIANAILGANGFSSRLLTRLRTEKGYAYSASSLWRAPSRYEGIVGAMTQTRSESTVAATRLILETMEEMRDALPEQEEVDGIVSQMVNGFVFNFQDPSQIVSRQMFYLAQGLPEDWLEEYARGIQRVDRASVRNVFRRHMHPEDMTILIVGNPEDFDLPPEVLGDVRIWTVGGGVIEPRREGRQFPH